MRTISIYGIVLGFFVAGFSFWRWGSGLLYDDLFRLFIGLFLAFTIMAFSYILDWMTLNDKKVRNLGHRIDSIAYPGNNDKGGNNKHE